MSKVKLTLNRSKEQHDADVGDVSFEEYLEIVKVREAFVRETFVMQVLTKQVAERLHAVRRKYPHYATMEDDANRPTPRYSGRTAIKAQHGPE